MQAKPQSNQWSLLSSAKAPNIS
jgi:Pretoxin HINT domain